MKFNNIKSSDLVVKSTKSYYCISFYKRKVDLMMGREYEKFIKSTEKLIRTSNEYKSYIGYLRANHDLLNCSILSNITYLQRS